ncbi:MAG: hypothetical protein MUC96_08170 [Myxococcaceae bacterium]|jgi:hypothetical protein|nr:hypothetical protein [Myxococcaceae bacterium]
MNSHRGLLWALVLAPLVSFAQDRPAEADLFGGEPAAPADGGATRPDEGSLFGDSDTPTQPSLTPDGGVDRDVTELSGSSKSKFDTDEVKADPLKIGANLNMFGQVLFQEGKTFAQEPVSLPILLETYLDGRPTDRLRAYGVARVQYDPSRPAGGTMTTSSTPTMGDMMSMGLGGLTLPGAGGVGLTTAAAQNPTVLLDQLWLRFDIARTVYLTVGRQKIRWGTARVWFPTDYLNSQPRDPFNPFDVRLGVNMVKVHVPVEKLGWNFYGYGLFDNIATGANQLTIGDLGGAVRAEFVVWQAELGVGAIWQRGRRPRYAVDLSLPIGPVDVYGEVALRDGRDFVITRAPASTTFDTFTTGLQQAALRNAFGEDFISAYADELSKSNVTIGRGTGLLAQVSGGLSWQFNYTEKNFGILAAEYFFNPAGYANPIEYQAQLFIAQGIYRLTPDPVQQIPLYAGRHYLALIASAPGIPEFPWITVNATNLLNLNDVSGLLRVDVIFRVLTYLNVQVFGAVFYGQKGGELRFSLPSQLESQLPAGTSIASPVGQAGVLLRLSI